MTNTTYISNAFPDGFLWGASTSAYQVEGAATEDGKRLSQQDVINRNSFRDHGFATSEIASDHYHHFREDVAEGALSFDFRLRPGPSSTRNAIALLAWANYPPEVVADALAAVESLLAGGRFGAAGDRGPT